MNLRIAAMASAMAALMAGGHALADTIEVGHFRQIAPRPLVEYSGSYGSYFTSSLVQNPESRTLVSIDLYGIMQAAGLNWLESVSVLDVGGNQYNGSPGADIDYFQVQGIDPAATVSLGYAGPNALHLAEASSTLATRVGVMDAIGGDQDWNCLHFVSLGLNGSLTASFLVPQPPGGGGGGGGGGGPDQTQGGGGSGGGSLSNLIQATSGLKLLVNEAGLGEGYTIRLTGYAVPAPAAAPLLGLAGLLGRGRRRRA